LRSGAAEHRVIPVFLGKWRRALETQEHRPP
jgi:hypothetical protein